MRLLELAEEYGLKLKRTSASGGGEWHGPCPMCGIGDDRFMISPNKQLDGSKCIGAYWCRQCLKGGDTIKFCREILKLSWEESFRRAGAPPSQKLSYLKPKQKKENKPLVPPSKAWKAQAHAFIEWAHAQILNEPSALATLQKRGLPKEAVIKYRIGWCPGWLPEEISKERESWGLPSNEEGKPLWFPSGMVIPTLEPSGVVVRIKIRRHDWKEGDIFPKYIAISGSMNGLNIIGDLSKKVVVAVESEFDAYALHHRLSDIITVIAVGSNTKDPDIVTDHLVRSASCLLICHDNDEGGKQMMDKWKGLYPYAIGCPVPKKYGKDIGEAIGKGLDVREFVLNQFQ